MIRAALDAVSLWAIPFLLVAIPVVGILRGVKVYDVFIEGAKHALMADPGRASAATLRSATST